MLHESSHHRVVGEDVGAWDLEKQPLRVVDVAVGGETEDFGERERVAGERGVGVSEDLGVDLIENSHVWTFLDQQR